MMIMYSMANFIVKCLIVYMQAPQNISDFVYVIIGGLRGLMKQYVPYFIEAEGKACL